jgi:serine/threonine-protein kinase
MAFVGQEDEPGAAAEPLARLEEAFALRREGAGVVVGVTVDQKQGLRNGNAFSTKEFVIPPSAVSPWSGSAPLSFLVASRARTVDLRIKVFARARQNPWEETVRFLERNRQPRRIGPFEIVEKIGEGGMSTIYRARQASLNRPVAVKVLKEKIGNNPEIRERFERESLIIARLNHPNIVHVVDRGFMSDGAPYFVMEYLDGTDLAQALAQGTLDRTHQIEIAIQICRALAYAHKNGVIHRDIKPANILLDREGNAIVLDFGIAKLVGTVPTNETRADLVLGTLAYMSPEQQTGEHPIGAASDLYSLGVILYEMVTGTRPCGIFRPPSAIDPAVSPQLDAVIRRCLDPEPTARFTSADEVRDRLLEILQGAHLGTEQRNRAATGLDRVRERFALLDVIREEPTGSVYLYQDRVDHRLFVIRKRLGSGAGLAEAKLLAALQHRRIANVHGASGDPRCFIVVMEYLTGGSLRDRLLQPLPVPEAIQIGRQAAEGLAFAHRNRIAHGSLRPGNLLFTEAGSVKVADFGFDEHAPAAGDPYNPFDEPRSATADVLALGIILHQTTTGVLPAWVDGLLTLYPQFLRLPPEVREILAGMLARNPAGRIPSCDQVAARLYGAESILAEAGAGAGRTARGRRSNPGGGGPAARDEDSTQAFELESASRAGILGRIAGRLRKLG